MTLVIDASVVVKWLVEEELADEAASLLGGSSLLHAPDLIVSEVTNALWGGGNCGDIPSKSPSACSQHLLAPTGATHRD